MMYGNVQLPRVHHNRVAIEMQLAEYRHVYINRFVPYSYLLVISQCMCLFHGCGVVYKVLHCFMEANITY